jgi:hypothetical protein
MAKSKKTKQGPPKNKPSKRRRKHDIVPGQTNQPLNRIPSAGLDNMEERANRHS